MLILSLLGDVACSDADPRRAGDGSAPSAEADAGPAPTSVVDADSPADAASATPPTDSAVSARDADQSAAAADAATPGAQGGLGAANLTEAELGATSHGGTITFQQIGARGWYPSRRDPAAGPCDAFQSGSCCMARHELTSDRLTPWDEDLILSLRGPLSIKQMAVYQPTTGDSWELVSAWDVRQPKQMRGIAFRGNGADAGGFKGPVGSECLVDVATDRPFACGPGSLPFCPPATPAHHHGWAGSKLFVLLASMPHAGEPGAGSACSDSSGGNWYDAPWLGLSLGELVRAGAFSSCHCYAKSPDEWWLGDGCGQFNVFEVVNDNNQYKNLELFSTNFFGYAGYVGEGPCGQGCDVSGLAPEVDLVDKGTRAEAKAGALASPQQGPRTAFRRPSRGFRYFLILLDVASREVQLAIVHPRAIPPALAGLLPELPGRVAQAVTEQVRRLRLPR